MRVLVIEDEHRLSAILKSKLGDIGFTVDIAGSAADARAAIELINYDAAILDLGLPDSDGLAVLTDTRQRQKPPDPDLDGAGCGRGQGRGSQCGS